MRTEDKANTLEAKVKDNSENLDIEARLNIIIEETVLARNEATRARKALVNIDKFKSTMMQQFITSIDDYRQEARKKAHSSIKNNTNNFTTIIQIFKLEAELEASLIASHIDNLTDNALEIILNLVNNKLDAIPNISS